MLDQYNNAGIMRLFRGPDDKKTRYCLGRGLMIVPIILLIDKLLLKVDCTGHWQKARISQKIKE